MIKNEFSLRINPADATIVVRVFPQDLRIYDRLIVGLVPGYYRLVQLQTGNMVSCTLCGFYIPRVGGDGNIQSRQRIWDHITFLEFLSCFKSNTKRHFKMASRGYFLAFLLLVEFENFLHH